jgi:hypothetical protein
MIILSWVGLGKHLKLEGMDMVVKASKKLLNIKVN